MRVLVLVLAAVLYAAWADAQQWRDQSQASASGTSGDVPFGPPPGGAKWDPRQRFMDSFALQEARLVWQYRGWRGADVTSSKPNASENACGGAPFLMTRTLTANGACTDRLTELNVSCSCVENAVAAGSSSISFRVRQQSPALLPSPPPRSISSREALEVSSIASLDVPPTLRSLSIIGEKSTEPQRISIGKLQRWGPASGQSALLRSTERINLTTVTVRNIDLLNVTASDDFFPDTITSLSLSNCNIPGFNVAFIRHLGNLASLDLSANSLAEPYERPQIERCVTGLCLLRSLNLSGNAFTTLPSSAAFYTALHELDLRYNPITNLTVSADAFKGITSLKAFYVSSDSAKAECSASTTKKSVHNLDFCVINSVLAGTTTSDSSSSTNNYLLIGVIAGCVIVVGLLVIVIRQRRAGNGSTSKDHQFPFFGTGNDNTVHGSSFDESFYNTGTANMLNDPIIITRRIQQSDIRIANCLSKGGFGVVYSGVYRRRRRVAIKKIRPEYNTNTSMIETFLREICLMATLRHVRIVEFIGVAWDSPRDLCAVTELMERGDVRDVLRHQRQKGKSQLSWENGKKTMIALHVAEALQYLHSLRPKVIHRDLKAKNILLNSKWEAKLSDFGISRERQLEETHMTAAVGTSFWIAPEVLLGRQDYDERADIYSFGVVLCEVDTEDYPFWTEDNPERGNRSKELAIMRQVAAGTMKPEFTPSCPVEILEIAESCLQCGPSERPTAREIVERLGSFLQSQGIVMPTPKTTTLSRGSEYSRRGSLFT